MPQPSHTARKFSAQKAFTDRTELLEWFEDGLVAQRPDEYRVLAVHGVGGHGKTRLCKEFMKTVAQRADSFKSFGWAHVDFENARFRQPEETLLHIRLALAKTAGVPFPVFNVAFIRHFELTQKSAPVRDRYPELFTYLNADYGNAVAAMTQASGIPFVGEAAKVFTTLVRGYGWARDAFQRYGREALEGIEELAAPDLFEALPRYLGADVAHYLTHSTSPRRLVVFVDTYERLWTGQAHVTGPAAVRVDNWVRRLAEELPGVLFVILGRDQLRWPEVDPSWTPVIEQRLLSELSAADADLFLRKVPITEDDIRHHIVVASRGVPFYLDLQVGVYERLMNRSEVPAVGAFGGTHPEIIARFLDHLDPAMVAALTALAHARMFDAEVLHALRQACPAQVQHVVFGELAQQSFVERHTDGFCTMHGLMREYLVASAHASDMTLARALHAALAAFWSARAEVAGPQQVDAAACRALAEAVFHLRLSDPQGCIVWFDAQFFNYLNAYAGQTLGPLTKELLPLCETRFGPDHAETAKALTNLARVLISQGEVEPAEPLLRRALATQEAALGADHPDTARTVAVLAGCFIGHGDHAAAEPLVRRALSIRERVLGAEHPLTLSTLDLLATTLSELGRHDEAAPLGQRVFEVRQRLLGPDHPDTAVALTTLADLLLKRGDFGAAEPLARRALAAQEKALPAGHPDIGLSLWNLAEALRGQDRLAEAEPLAERSLKVWETALGASHPWTAWSLGSLAEIRLAKGLAAQALPLAERSLRIHERAFGPTHPTVAASQCLLARALQAQGDCAGAEALLTLALESNFRQLPVDLAAVQATRQLLAAVRKQPHD